MQFSSTCANATALALALALSAMTPGCATDAPEVDKSALYTPESLAEELAFRYRELKPEDRMFARGAVPRAGSAGKPADLERARQIDEKAEQKKGGGGAVSKKRSGSPTLDEVMADIDSKIGRIPATPRPDARRKMIEALSKDAALSAEDKALLSDRLKEMGAS
jgi:hypothetical protein